VHARCGVTAVKSDGTTEVRKFASMGVNVKAEDAIKTDDIEKAEGADGAAGVDTGDPIVKVEDSDEVEKAAGDDGRAIPADFDSGVEKKAAPVDDEKDEDEKAKAAAAADEGKDEKKAEKDDGGMYMAARVDGLEKGVAAILTKLDFLFGEKLDEIKKTVDGENADLNKLAGGEGLAKLQGLTKCNPKNSAKWSNGSPIWRRSWRKC
jgi:hypothetical protein